ncbi:YbhB/YbcL family Raf kinase inhibitor-like protein [Beijerinckia indica]|uniref:PEBP family protein n=1 Tax=Beijerinckia indica subsp. indica (strain ATCC 9039 / DSM 1715 / NCIMB 8712) TaxID=395963 RepID=B2IHL6_BEII9|nr:YbhB/YbcL family Raf kinase inhibitor-like protein [Beijerinckia indica]ACB94537.1 PEBP family protein [Beijerinckia indica subsp. indica ATCC 9039]
MLSDVAAAFGHMLENYPLGPKTLVYRDARTEAPELIKVESQAFENYYPIPPLFTSDGENVSPPLKWEGVPEAAQSLVLLVEDADSPTYNPVIHALNWTLPGHDGGLRPGVLQTDAATDDETLTGQFSVKASWVAPNPPIEHGPHRYLFEIYALDTRLHFAFVPSREQLLTAMRGHVLAKGQVTGICERMD